MERVCFYICRLLLCESTVFKADTVFCQICIEGNIASGKTTCLDYFAQTTSLEVLDVQFFVFIYIMKQLLVLTKLAVNLEVLSSLRVMRKEQQVVSQCTYWCTSPSPNYLQSNCRREIWIICNIVLDAKILVKPVDESLYLCKVTASHVGWACLGMLVCYFMSLKS